MKNSILHILTAGALLLAGGILSSCDDRIGTDEAPEYHPVITVSKSILAAPAAGTGEAVGYTLEDAPEGSVVTVVSDSKWVEVTSVSGSEAVLVIKENTTQEDRTATVTFSFKGAKDAFMVVMQAAAAQKEKSHFEIKVSNITTVGADITVVPDSQISWLYGIVTKSEYEALGAKGYIDARLKQIDDMIKIYPGVSLEKFLAVGTMNSIANTLNDDTDYYATAFDLTKDRKSSGFVALKEFRTKAAARSSNRITVTMSGAVLKCTPTVNSDTYLCDVVAKDIWDEYGAPKAIAQDYVLTMKSYGYLEASLRSGTYMENYGDYLEKGKEYVAYAFGYRYISGEPSGSIADGSGITTDVFSCSFVY